VLDSEVLAVHDLGRESGALVVIQCSARNAADQHPLFTVQRGIFARGDGGFGATHGAVPAPHPMPSRLADLGCTLQVGSEQALVYRLSGDMNPIHADPDVAHRAGLPGPVLQNLCTFGIAARGVIETICDYDPTLITGFEGRYTGGVYPGDTLRLELWQDANVVSFRVSVPARGRAVIDHGRCALAG
jgi:acyl dehydratase